MSKQYAGMRSPKVVHYPYHQERPYLPKQYVVDQTFGEGAIIGVAKLAVADFTMFGDRNELDDAKVKMPDTARRLVIAGVMIGPNIPKQASHLYEFLECDVIILPRKRVLDTNKVVRGYRIDQILTTRGLMNDPEKYFRQRAGIDDY